MRLMIALQRVPRGVVLLLVCLVAAGCTGDDPAGGVSPSPTSAAAVATEDPRRDALVAQLAQLAETVAAARDLLDSAAASGDPAAARQALPILTADVSLAGDDAPPVPPLLPGPETSREETIDYGDHLTRTTVMARDAGGQLGAQTARLLADQVAGDLGIWQRDAAGLLAEVDRVADPGTEISEAETAVLELPGEGTRALAYALLAARSTDAEAVSAFAERAIAHLDLITLALQQLRPETS